MSKSTLVCVPSKNDLNSLKSVTATTVAGKCTYCSAQCSACGKSAARKTRRAS